MYDLLCRCGAQPLLSWCVENVHLLQLSILLMVLGVVLVVSLLARHSSMVLQERLKEVNKKLEGTYGDITALYEKIKEYHPDDDGS